jgi:hypothetical protein
MRPKPLTGVAPGSVAAVATLAASAAMPAPPYARSNLGQTSKMKCQSIATRPGLGRNLAGPERES